MSSWFQILSSGITGGGGGGTITFSDNFTRANENPLSKSGAWTNGITGYGNMLINSNFAFGVSGGVNNGAIVTTPSFTSYANQSASLTMPSSIGTIGVFVRMSTSGNGYRLAVTSSTALVSRIDGGTGTTLGASYTVSLVPGDIATLSITGTTLTFSINGSPQGTTRTDATYASGSPGVYSFSNTNSCGPFSTTSL